MLVSEKYSCLNSFVLNNCVFGDRFINMLYLTVVSYR
jgi:hypothetical protein